MSDTEMTGRRASELLRDGADEAEIYPAWTEWLYETYGFGLSREQLDKVYGVAWDHGHSAGLEEVGEYFREFADFARELLAVS